MVLWPVKRGLLHYNRLATIEAGTGGSGAIGAETQQSEEQAGDAPVLSVKRKDRRQDVPIRPNRNAGAGPREASEANSGFAPKSDGQEERQDCRASGMAGGRHG